MGILVIACSITIMSAATTNVEMEKGTKDGQNSPIGNASPSPIQFKVGPRETCLGCLGRIMAAAKLLFIGNSPPKLQQVNGREL